MVPAPGPCLADLNQTVGPDILIRIICGRRSRLIALAASTTTSSRTEIGRASCRESAQTAGAAEDGIRDGHVTGVQTCALPILACPAETCIERGNKRCAHNGSGARTMPC